MQDFIVIARIQGRVQGVSFRAWTRDHARRLGLTGWVRNEPDGSVRAMIAGPRGSVERMLDHLNDGPPAARVDAVQSEVQESADFPRDFSILG